MRRTISNRAVTIVAVLSLSLSLQILCMDGIQVKAAEPDSINTVSDSDKTADENNIAMTENGYSIEVTDEMMSSPAVLSVMETDEVILLKSSPVADHTLTDIGSYVIACTDEERDWFLKVVAAEARGEALDGKIAVAEVIINRVKSSDFANNITDVIFTARQFSPVSDGSIYSAYDECSDEIQEEVRVAVETALQGSNTVQGCVWFRTRKYHDDTVPFKVIGKHYFSK